MKDFTKIIMTSLILFGVVQTTVFGGSKARRGTAGAQELLIPTGSRGTAMSGANVSSIAGVEAAHWNIAGLAGMESNGEVMFSNSNWLVDDVGINYGIIGVSKGQNYFAFSLKSFGTGEIPVTTEEQPDGTGEYFSPQFFTLGVSYARRMTDRIKFGTQFKLINENIMRESATGIALDAGVQYETNGGIHIGASINNLGNSIRFYGSDLEEFHAPQDTEPGTPLEPRAINTSPFELPTTFEMGVGYEKKMGTTDLLLAASFLNNNFSFDEFRFGVEAKTMDMFYLRGGLAIAQDPEPFGDDGIEGTDDDSEDEEFEYQTDEFIWGPSFGFGVDLSKVLGVGLTVDYAYRTVAYLNGVGWLSLNYAF